MRALLYWLAMSIVLGAGYSLFRGVEEFVKKDRIEPENDDQARERMEKVRDAGHEVGIWSDL